jgi:hypothetical protein
MDSSNSPEDTTWHISCLESNEAVAPLATNLSSLTVDLFWSYGFGTFTTSSSDVNFLANAGLKASVAVDLFFDSDLENSTSTTIPKYELMVWLGWFGGVEPVGYLAGVRAEKVVNSIKLFVVTLPFDSQAPVN